MTEETPILTAGPRPPGIARPIAPSLAPIAWGLSVAVHMAAIAGFFELPERHEPDEQVGIDVELVVNLPVLEVAPPDGLEPLSVLQPQALREAPVPAAVALQPRGSDADLAAVEPDRVPPLTPPPALSPRLDPDLVSVTPAEPVPVERTTEKVELPAVATGGPELRPLQSDRVLPSAGDGGIRLTMSSAARAPAPVAHAATPVDPSLPPMPDGVAVVAAPPPAVRDAAPPVEAVLSAQLPETAAVQAGAAPTASVVAAPQVAALPTESVPEPLVSPNPPIEVPLQVEAEAGGRIVAVPPVQGENAERDDAVIEQIPGQSIIPVPDPAPDAKAGEGAVAVASLIRPFAPPAPDPRPALAEAVVNLECGRVEAAFDDLNGSVRLSGHIRSMQDREKLTAMVAAIAGIREVAQSDLQVVGEPYCQVLDFLARPELARSDDQRQDVEAITQPAQAGVLTLKGGMPLSLQLTGPDYPSYVYVDYFTADGRVYHLLPTASLADHRLASGERLTIGGREGRGVKATIGPPFGLDMVVALASEQPLYASVRPVAESADAYLKALERMTAEARRRHPGLRLEYSYYLIRTAQQ